MSFPGLPSQRGGGGEGGGGGASNISGMTEQEQTIVKTVCQTLISTLELRRST